VVRVNEARFILGIERSFSNTMVVSRSALNAILGDALSKKNPFLVCAQQVYVGYILLTYHK